MAAQQIALVHALWSEETFSDGELVQVTVLDWSPPSVPHELKNEGQLLISVSRPVREWGLISRACEGHGTCQTHYSFVEHVI